jgi:hemoglobin
MFKLRYTLPFLLVALISGAALEAKDTTLYDRLGGNGGPCKYTGKDMKSAHAGMGIKEADFNALVEDLVGALDKFKVAAADKNTLLGVLGPMKGDIVTRH